MCWRCVMPCFGQQGSHTGTQIGTLTGLLFYVTSHARTYSGSELEEFLEAAGFERVRSRRHPRLPGSVLVLGRAPKD